MFERDVDVLASGARLAGTLCLPTESGSFALVLMVHGSGPLDRDENMKGQKLNVFNAVAHRLAADGIASVRFDKRGCGASEGDYYTTGHHQHVDDVLVWYDSLRQSPFCRAGQLFLLGHSEGCLVAARASARQPGSAGLVMLCPFVEPMQDILLRQASQIEREMNAITGVMRLVNTLAARIFGGPVASQRALIERVKSTSDPSIRVSFERIPAKWLRELMSVDAAAAYREVTCPMLLVGGEKDLQCDPADIAKIAGLARTPAVQHIIADMTHVLRCDDEPPTLFGSQRLLVRPVEPEVLTLVSDWIRSRTI